MSLTAAFYGKCHPSADIIRIPISKNNTSHYYFFFSDSFDSVTTFERKTIPPKNQNLLKISLKHKRFVRKLSAPPLSPLHTYKHTHTHTQTYIWMYLLNKNVHGMVAFIFIQKFHAPRALGEEGRNIRIILNSMDSFYERWGCRKFMRISFRLVLFFFFTSTLSEKGFLQEKSKLFILNRMLYLFIALVSARRIHSLTFIELGIRAGMEAIKFCI